MSRTILPPWSEFRKTLGVEQPEPIETFQWMFDEVFSNDLTLAKEGIDSIEGARAFLKDYRRPLEDDEIHPMRFRIGCAFGGHHSGASVSMLMNTYTYLLNNWDEFVLKTKDRERRKSSNYNSRQIHYSEQDEFLATLKDAKGSDSKEKAVIFTDLCDNFREKYGVSYDNDTLIQLITAIRKEEYAEGDKKMAEMKASQLQEDIDMLTFLYRCPIRWFSYEDGLSPFSVDVTPEHIDAMASIYPDYRDHYAAVVKAHHQWNHIRNTPEKKPTAAFFEAFSAPHVLYSEMYTKKQTYPDYEKHIRVIAQTRETQLHDMVLGKMFASPAVLKIQREAEAAMAARYSQPLSSLFSTA